MSDVTAMWQEIVTLKNKIDAEEQKGGEGNPELLNQWRQEVKDLEDLITKTEQNAIQQDHDTRVDGTVSAVDTDLDAIDFSGFTIRQLIPVSDDYLLISIGIKQYIQSLADKFSQQIAGLQAASNDQKRSFDEREIQLQRQNDALQQKLSKRDLEYNDLETRFAAATNELMEVAQERDSLKAQVVTLRKSPQESTKTVEQMEEENRQKDEAAARIRKERTIYNKRWQDDIRQNVYIANLAATGEEIQFPWTEATKYFVIDEAQVSQFREQYAIAVTPEVPDVAETPVQTAEPVAVPQFPTIQGPSTVGPVKIPAHSSDGPLVEETPITRAEFEARLADQKAEILAEIRGAA